MPGGRRHFLTALPFAGAVAASAPAAETQLYSRLLSTLDETRLVNTHEHIIPKPNALP